MKEVLKFSASWCGPCKMLAMTINELEDSSLSIKNIDIDEQLDLATKYNIRSVPTMVILEDDVEVKRKTGSMNLQQLKEFLA